MGRSVKWPSETKCASRLHWEYKHSRAIQGLSCSSAIKCTTIYSISSDPESNKLNIFSGPTIPILSFEAALPPLYLPCASGTHLSTKEGKILSRNLYVLSSIHVTPALPEPEDSSCLERVTYIPGPASEAHT